MNKLVIISLLLPYNAINYAKITPIKLETGLLSIADGTLINNRIMHLIQKYKKQLNSFMRKKFVFNNETLHLPECVRLEDAGSLNTSHKELFNNIVQEFLSFSEPFLEYLQQVKSGLVPLIEEDCIKRNRSTSLLLKWAHIQHGQERILFDKHIVSYRLLFTFCHDVCCFLEDLEHSCPKATKGYHEEMAYQHVVRNQVDGMLAAENRILTDHQYRELLHILSSQPNHLTSHEITTLYQTYISKVTT